MNAILLNQSETITSDNVMESLKGATIESVTSDNKSFTITANQNGETKQFVVYYPLFVDEADI